MRSISDPMIQNHLGVAGQLDPPGLVTGVAKRNPPQFQIGLRGDANI